MIPIEVEMNVKSNMNAENTVAYALVGNAILFLSAVLLIMAELMRTTVYGGSNLNSTQWAVTLALLALSSGIFLGYSLSVYYTVRVVEA